MNSLTRPLILTAIAAAAATATTTDAQDPSVGYSSMMTNLRAYPTGLIGQNGDLQSVFLPDRVLQDSTRDFPHQDQVFTALFRADGTEIKRVRMSAFPLHAVFSRIQGSGTPVSFEVPGDGDYEMRVLIGDTSISSMPFSAKFVGGDDPFNPAKTMTVSGPWDNLICLKLDGPSDPDEIVKVRYWPYAVGAKAEKWDLQVHLGGEMIYETKETHVASTLPVRSELSLQFPKAAGGDWVRLKDLTKVDGTYEFVVRRGGTPIATYPITVAGGKVVAHERSSLSFTPHDKYLCSREYHDLRTHDLLWASAGASSGAVAATAATEASAADLDRWAVKPAGSATAPLQIVHTPVPARFDAAIAAGDGVIAFGTGGWNGVAYMTLGDTQSRSIPEGQSYRAGFLGVCGKKIVLVNGAHVSVFDTETESMTKIAEDVVHLGKPVKSMSEPGPLDVSGYLVATVNDPTKTADRKVVKLLDLSGSTPRVINLANAEFQGREVTDIAVDAGTGLVAVSVKRNSAIYTAPAVEGGVFTKTDVSGHDGVEDCRMIASGGRVAYRDDAGTAKLRVLMPASNQILTLATLGPPTQGYAMTGDRYALAGGRSNGSDYAWFSGSSAKGTADLGEGLEQKSTLGNGIVGFGQTCALLPDGTYFIAGNGKGGLGSGEFLMACIDGKWMEFTGADGKALRACDVVAGNRMVAFKSGKVKDTTISFATFGDQVRP